MDELVMDYWVKYFEMRGRNGHADCDYAGEQGEVLVAYWLANQGGAVSACWERLHAVRASHFGTDDYPRD